MTAAQPTPRPQKTFRRADPANFANIPEELRRTPQWQCWKFYEGRKIPVDPFTGSAYPKGVKSDDMRCGTFDEACACLAGDKDLLGPGFRFKSNDPYCGVDWDHCRNPETGDMEEWAQESLAEFSHTYCEISPSGTGAHAICRARIPKSVTHEEGLRIEMYFTGQYLCFTGQPLNGSPSTIADAQQQATALFKQLTMNPAGEKNAPKLNGSGKISHGKIDNWLASQAGLYRSRGDGPDQIEKKLLIDYYERCAPPHDNEERVKQIARGMTRYEPGRGEWPEVAETLEQFNKQFYVIEDLGGKCRVCSEKPSPVFASAIDFMHQSFEDFRKRFYHQLIKTGEDAKGNPVYQDRGHVWLHHKDRRQFCQVIYAPEQKLDDDVRNLWRGFAYEPKKGDCGLYLKHLFDNVCQGDETRYAWLTGWMAYALRQPPASR